MLQQSALQFRRATLWTLAASLALLTVVPALMPAFVSAAPTVTERELQSTSAQPGLATSLTWIFDTTTDTANIDHIEIEFCDTPLASCSNVDGDTADPAGGGSTDNIPLLPASPTATLTNFTSGGNTASRVDGRQANTAGSGNQITIDKTTADAGASLNEAQITIGGFTNDDVANRSYYTRMRIYSDAGTTLVWEGVFAQSTSQTLTVNARVQERLDFCVGSTAVDDGTTATPADCSAVTGNSVDIGNIENGFTNVSPVDSTNGGNGLNGIAMVRTNAVNGIVVDYRSLQDTSSGKLKVPSATCSGTSTTDQCFNSAGTTGVTIASGTERFGMLVSGVNCTSTTAYTCAFGSGTYNLARDAEYDGGASATTYLTETNTLGQVTGTTTGLYAWDDTGAADRIASSAGSTVKVVDDEALILKFGATAGVTTPTGSYTVQADYIATATF